MSKNKKIKKIENNAKNTLLTKFMTVYSSEIFQEKSSAKFYFGKIIERTPAGKSFSS